MKRKRGAQKGNQNARKHGLYCGPMTPDEMCEYWNLLNTRDIDPEVAVLFIKVRSSIKHASGNRRLIRDAVRLLACWYSKKLRLNRADTNLLRKSLSSLLLDAGVDPGLVEQSGDTILTKQIERTLKT